MKYTELLKRIHEEIKANELKVSLLLDMACRGIITEAQRERSAETIAEKTRALREDARLISRYNHNQDLKERGDAVRTRRNTPYSFTEQEKERVQYIIKGYLA